MRAIKFRGKAVMTIEELDEMHFEHDDGWFYGNLVMHGTTPYIVGDFMEVDLEYTINEFWVSVHPDSVGQYTGLTDKNDREIYEGDLLKSPFSSKCAEIIFDTGMSAFPGIDITHENGWTLDDLTAFDGTEVIGNIYENPELLEGEE